MISEVLYSSEKTEWETPRDFFEKLDDEFCFDWDACATEENAQVPNFWSPEQNALVQDWTKVGTIWMNPPYGRHIEDWVQRAREASLQKTDPIVCLLPVRTCTNWFHRHVYNKSEIRFVRGRLKFEGAEHSAPFPSMIAIYH